MKTIRSHYLDDGRAFNQGQAASLIEIEGDEDFDQLLQYIVDSDFYGRAYLPRQSGQGDERLVAHFWWVAEMVALLAPRLVLEIGCGRGDVLRLLREAHGADVVGVDFGSDVSNMLWPALRGSFHAGDVLEVLRDWPGRPYDLACGFDIWEHLLPRTLDSTIAELIAHATDDALFVFVIPAFGDDVVFHEQFPLEFEENREAFDRREPFRFLVTDAVDEKVPAAGHLIWAHTDWWVAAFRGARPGSRDALGAIDPSDHRCSRSAFREGVLRVQPADHSGAGARRVALPEPSRCRRGACRDPAPPPLRAAERSVVLEQLGRRGRSLDRLPFRPARAIGPACPNRHRARTASETVTAIHQFIPTLAPRDAVGTHTIALRDALREAGYRSDIFALEAKDAFKNQARDFRAFRGSAPGSPVG